jgi:midasin (ATPase involved in ribosome maturation)
MPVFRSVELNVVPWAKAGRVLSASMAATMSRGRSRERIWGASIFFMAFLFLRFFFWFSGSSADHANTISRNCGDECARLAQNESGFLIDKRPMNTALNENKLARLNELTMILPREIRGQSQVLPRIISTVKRGELGLTKPGRPRGSFLLLGPTGVGKTETVVVLTSQIFGAGQLFRYDMSEFQTQESLGLLLGAKLGETGYLGAMRERAAEGSLLFDEVEKAHPRVLDILLQLLDAARITVATGQTLDFSGFYIWLTSNIGSAELMGLQLPTTPLWSDTFCPAHNKPCGQKFLRASMKNSCSTA